uniref:ADAMTS like 5 n=1 Tax=Gasterosteus aculeatus TaxID=69293 RepID=G3PZJ5_GASAC
EWAAWSGWSVCSRSCGSGASVRTRTCITRNPAGGPCSGDPRQYRICNTKECPPSSEDFREMQCAAFNDRPLVAGNSFQWTTFHGGLCCSKPCELSCLALGHNFYYNFGRVLDGTACNTEPGAVCVNGRCLKPGCDSILGSEQREDACMVCGGLNTTCLHHRSVYQSSRQEAGFWGRTALMSGADQVPVRFSNKQNVTLQNGRSQFVINGNWKINIPGEYSVAGTKLLYRRSADTWESFEVPGPTQEDLHLMVLATDRNPGIEYEYWLPPGKYALHHGRSPLRGLLPSPPDPTGALEAATPIPPPQPPPAAHPAPSGAGGHCGKCRRVKGRRERQRQYCQKDFVFRGRVLGKLYRGEETRYDVQILHTYRNGFRLEHREFLWVPNVCDCPRLQEGRQYVLMVRRHINHERTLNRILLEEDGYAAPYRPREDALLRPLHRLCSN